MSNKLFFTLLAMLFGFLILASSVYIIDQRERAVVSRFGRLIEVDVKPGLHFKSPMMDRVVRFDGQILTTDMNTESFFTIENKRLMVDSFIKWRIKNTEVYYKASGGIEVDVANRLVQRVADGLRNQFGRRTLHDVVSGQRDELMSDLKKTINETASESLGIEVIDIRVKRIDFPQEVSQSVFERMKADREKQAREYRAQGNEKSEGIKADAERQKVVLESSAYRDAERLRGEGDAKAAAIYAAAYNKDSEFYAFVRSLNAYKSSFSSKDDFLVVDPKSDFFRYFKDPQGKR